VTSNSSTLPYDIKYLRELVKQTNEKREKRYKLVALGPTKGGRSTFLRQITNMKGCFLSAVERETTHFWRFKEQGHSAELNKSFTF
jgi:ABC-type polar amino acid transport system ATPase subunit